MPYPKVSLLGFSLVLLLACSNEVTVESGATGDSSHGGAASSSTSGKGSTKTSAQVTSTTSASGGAGGIGLPSDVYPAPHDSPPQVVSLGGSVISAPSFVPIFFQNDDPSHKTGAIAFMNAIGTTSYWHDTTSEYGVGPGAATPPVSLNESPPTLIDDSDIQLWLAGKLNADDPAFPAPNANRVYTIYYPNSVTITSDDGQGGKSVSCQNFGGYHGTTTLDGAHGNMEVVYAVMPDCGVFGPLTGLDALTGPVSHELIEAATDPHPFSLPAFGQTDVDHIAWTFALGGEVGDMCSATPGVFTNFPGLANVAQRTWSNASVVAGHDPCVPIPQGQVYFNAVPKLPDLIDLGGGFQFKGVTIPLNGTKTIDVNLFSEGPTEAFSVQALDASSIQGGPQDLDLFFDQDSGQNGQTLHLTITVLNPGQYGFEMFYLYSSLNGVSQMWVGAVGN